MLIAIKTKLVLIDVKSIATKNTSPLLTNFKYNSFRGKRFLNFPPSPSTLKQCWKLYCQMAWGVEIKMQSEFAKSFDYNQVTKKILFQYLVSGYPPSPRRWVSPGNLASEFCHSSEFRKIRESWTEPGHPARTSLNTIWLSHTTCWKKCFYCYISL